MTKQKKKYRTDVDREKKGLLVFNLFHFILFYNQRTVKTKYERPTKKYSITTRDPDANS